MQRLRAVAMVERQRRSNAAGRALGGRFHDDVIVGARVGAKAGGGHGQGGGGAGRAGGEQKMAPEVTASVEELRRVAVHGDATTLDVLLSSQVGV